MIGVLFSVIQSLFGAFRPRGDLLLENLALRHQIAVLSRRAKKPRFSNSDRLLWIFLRRIWSRWKGSIGDSATTDGGRLVPDRISLILVMEFEEPRETFNRSRADRIAPPNEGSQPDVGRSRDPR